MAVDTRKCVAPIGVGALVVGECRAELCSMWGGDDCLCEVFGIDPDNPPRNGTFTVSVTDNSWGPD